MNKLLLCVLGLILLMFQYSCSFHHHSRKKFKTFSNSKDSVLAIKTDSITLIEKHPVNIAKADSVAQKAVPKVAIPDYGFLMQSWNNRLAYNTFSGKAKVHYTSTDQDQEFTINFRIRKDSLIWMAITAMGGMVQAARVAITPDSICMINYLQSEYTSLPLSQVAKILPTKVDFSVMQNLIVGYPAYGGPITKSDTTNDGWYLETEDSFYQQHISYNRLDTLMAESQIRTVNTGGPRAKVTYKDYDALESRKIATRRTVYVENGNETYLMELKFVNFNFDQPLEFPFSVPKNYARK